MAIWLKKVVMVSRRTVETRKSKETVKYNIDSIQFIELLFFCLANKLGIDADTDWSKETDHQFGGERGRENCHRKEEKDALHTSCNIDIIHLWSKNDISWPIYYVRKTAIIHCDRSFSYHCPDFLPLVKEICGFLAGFDYPIRYPMRFLFGSGTNICLVFIVTNYDDSI